MTKWWVCCLCLLSSGAWAQEEEVLPEQEPLERAPALWIQPLPVLLLPAGLVGVPFIQESFIQLTFVAVPLGLTVPVRPGEDWVFELTPFYQHRLYDTSHDAKALYLSVGKSWMPSPNRAGQGWFLQPKISAVVAQAFTVDNHSGVLFDGWSGQVSLGLDAGYRVHADRLFVEFAPGLSVGYGWNVPSGRRSVIELAVRGGNGSTPRQKVVMDVNLNVLRLGFRF